MALKPEQPCLNQSASPGAQGAKLCSKPSCFLKATVGPALGSKHLLQAWPLQNSKSFRTSKKLTSHLQACRAKTPLSRIQATFFATQNSSERSRNPGEPAGASFERPRVPPATGSRGTPSGFPDGSNIRGKRKGGCLQDPAIVPRRATESHRVTFPQPGPGARQGLSTDLLPSAQLRRAAQAGVRGEARRGAKQPGSLGYYRWAGAGPAGAAARAPPLQNPASGRTGEPSPRSLPPPPGPGSGQVPPPARWAPPPARGGGCRPHTQPRGALHVLRGGGWLAGNLPAGPSLPPYRRRAQPRGRNILRHRLFRARPGTCTRAR